ncbi:hypothetical protein HPY28_18240 [Brevibacillus sp. HB1.2]|nr:hypothetical protein A616_19135 [Brevibacillus brevis X23]NTU22267.1 hypothetical protein [Brevibacillus sp. HB1.2]NTU28794.1 hypothetical protein [Brevibacillus sp. HB1.1]
MNKFEKGIVYFFSFVFFPIGLIIWVVSLFNQNQQFKSVGRTALYIATVSFCIQLLIGVLNFVVYANITFK